MYCTYQSKLDKKFVSDLKSWMKKTGKDVDEFLKQWVNLYKLRDNKKSEEYIINLLKEFYNTVCDRGDSCKEELVYMVYNSIFKPLKMSYYKEDKNVYK